MEDVRCATVNPDFPHVLFFHLASVEAGRSFFAKRAPGAPVVADQSQRFYKGFGLKRGDWQQLIGLRAIKNGVLALARGHFIGRALGDPFVMPGSFLCRGDTVLWEHRATHAGDQPDLGHVAEFAASLARDSRQATADRPIGLGARGA